MRFYGISKVLKELVKFGRRENKHFEFLGYYKVILLPRRARNIEVKQDHSSDNFLGTVKEDEISYLIKSSTTSQYKPTVDHKE